MGFSICLMSMLFNLVVTNFVTCVQPFACHDYERFALLEFKQSFVIDKIKASRSESAYPKVLHWNSEENSNCCSWDGIECDEENGHVVSLDLSSSCLFGSINSNSSLFQLHYLQSLNLADNHFNHSQIPTLVGRFSSLTYLNLSSSAFSGQVPLEIFLNLSNLSSLDLSDNYDGFSGQRLLRLGGCSEFNSLVQHLTSLKHLHLSGVGLSSTLPDSFANLTSLATLALNDCELYGEFPVKVFQLSNLRYVDVSFNYNLTCHLPANFHHNGSLSILGVRGTGFSGCLNSIEMLESLEELDFSECNISGPIPNSLGNKLTKLTFLSLENNNLMGYIPSSFQNLTQLNQLSLFGNHLVGPIPSWLGNLTKLTFLSLENNNLMGYIPSSFQNLTQLNQLSLFGNHLVGPIPSWLGNLTQLTYLDLQVNQLHGSIPQSLYNLMNLQYLGLSANNLGGTVNFDVFFNMKSLFKLQLSFSNLTLVFDRARKINSTISKFKHLSLCDCNLVEFPDFLRYQNNLEWLILSQNKIHGQIPKWIWNTSIETLVSFHISENFLTGFHQSEPIVLPHFNLQKLDLSFNKLRGPLPIPPPSLMDYNASNNMLNGEISPVFCNLTSLYSLALSNNNLSGLIPQCFGNLSDSLSVLDLRNNSLHGNIPRILCKSASKMKMIDLSYNQLLGKLPRSLSKCLMLEGLALSNNQLIDVFPSWLGSLPELKVLTLRSNKLHGEIVGKPEKDSKYFPKLRVIDLSCNRFTGLLPYDYMFHWDSMKTIKLQRNITYIDAYWVYTLSNSYASEYDYRFSITIMYKGVDIHYSAIQDVFAFIDLSSNKFEGEIPKSIGNLEALRSLNLSNNMLTGRIPSSLRALSVLESLDLSRNNLSGEIPQELKQLGFLSHFNVSHNNLRGPIPQGKQFNTMEQSSFEWNPSLCGDPLPKKCGYSQGWTPPSSSFGEDDDDLEISIKSDWKFVLAGFISGLVVGVVLADMVITKNQTWTWLVKIFETRATIRRRERMRHRN